MGAIWVLQNQLAVDSQPANPTAEPGKAGLTQLLGAPVGTRDRVFW
jgi:hypothetical protein